MFRRIRVLAAVVLVGALLGAPTVSASASEASHAAGNQKFIILQTKASEETGGTVIGLGPIHAVGTDFIVSEFVDRFKFPDGNLVIKHRPKKGSQHEFFDPETCYFKFTERGKWKVVKGTGAYANYTGGGTYKVHAHGIGCDEEAPPEEFALMITAVGDLATP